jgi:hypothetical protein
MVYVHIHSRGHTFKTNAVRATPHNDLVAHPSLQIVNLRVGGEMWRIVNFYNDTEDTSALQALLNLNLDPLIPNLVVEILISTPLVGPPLALTGTPRQIELRNGLVGMASTSSLPLGFPQDGGKETNVTVQSTSYGATSLHQ